MRYTCFSTFVHYWCKKFIYCLVRCDRILCKITIVKCATIGNSWKLTTHLTEVTFPPNLLIMFQPVSYLCRNCVISSDIYSFQMLFYVFTVIYLKWVYNILKIARSSAFFSFSKTFTTRWLHSNNTLYGPEVLTLSNSILF